MRKDYFYNVVRGLQSTIAKASKDDKDSKNDKDPKDSKNDKDPKDSKNAPPPKSGEPEETEYPGGRPPRTLGEIIASAGEDGITFAEIIRRYAELSGQRSRKVNRTTILYSIDTMLEKGKIIAINREGMTVYKSAKYANKNKEGTSDEKPAEKKEGRDDKE
jgi:hypothetical protein